MLTALCAEHPKHTDSMTLDKCLFTGGEPTNTSLASKAAATPRKNEFYHEVGITTPILPAATDLLHHYIATACTLDGDDGGPDEGIRALGWQGLAFWLGLDTRGCVCSCTGKGWSHNRCSTAIAPRLAQTNNCIVPHSKQMTFHNRGLSMIRCCNDDPATNAAQTYEHKYTTTLQINKDKCVPPDAH